MEVGCNVYVYLHSRRIFSATECILAVQSYSGSFKVDDFGTNRKRMCDFILVINSNFGPILHRFRDTASYWLKIAYFPHPSHSAPSLPSEGEGAESSPQADKRSRKLSRNCGES